MEQPANAVPRGLAGLRDHVVLSEAMENQDPMVPLGYLAPKESKEQQGTEEGRAMVVPLVPWATKEIQDSKVSKEAPATVAVQASKASTALVARQE